MIENIIDYLYEWKKNTSERQKLQHIYISAAILILIIAGLISLIDAPLGRDAARFAVLSVGIFVANAVVWSLVDSMLLKRIPTRTRKKRK